MTLREVFNVRSLTKAEIMSAIKDSDWQAFRLTLHYVPLNTRLTRLFEYLNGGNDLATAPFEVRHVVVINYLNALARGGMLDLEDPCPTSLTER
jgi:hypothetical protein